ncbi:MAG: 2-isopropylmalate synthase [Ignavibacteriae bacterium]|nr:MAG: 2-isopropylmalate synthase [Ignavibacteriota bacterium]
MENRIFIFDTTLRDGEQSPGCSMNIEEKLRLARQLQLLSVDVIEAGFPIASVGDFEAVKLVAEKIKSCTVAALARTVKLDIDRAWEAIQGAEKPRIHTFIATSDLHLKYKLKKSREQVLQDAVWAVQYAKSLCEEVEFSCEDASRTNIDYLCAVVEATINAGATIINLPDTVGYAIPDEYGAMFRMVRERVPNIDKAILSSHCHNDLGLAVANSIAAVQNGVRQVECTLNGIGERAGNASLEEIAMAIKTRHEKLGLRTNIDTEEIYKSSKLLSSLTGMMVQRNKAIVGANAFAHEAGIHQDGVLKSPITYEIMTPQSVGIKHTMLVLGKHSGRHALKQRYTELGYTLSDEELQRAYKLFCEIADQKKELFDEDLEAILETSSDAAEEVYQLTNIQIVTGTNLRPTATIELKYGDQMIVDSATGDGPVDAAYKAIERITGVIGKLTEYSIKSVSLGHDAIGEVFVRVDFDGLLYNGRAASTDILAGSARAYLEALNRAMASKKRKEEQQKLTLSKDGVTV